MKFNENYRFVIVVFKEIILLLLIKSYLIVTSVRIYMGVLWVSRCYTATIDLLFHTV
jgi:hypothetical protein